jgi:hypothetical protein
MRYKIILQGVGARQCRALTGVPHVNENRYSDRSNLVLSVGVARRRHRANTKAKAFKITNLSKFA